MFVNNIIKNWINAVNVEGQLNLMQIAVLIVSNNNIIEKDAAGISKFNDIYFILIYFINNQKNEYK
jgi:hypothetical protein